MKDMPGTTLSLQPRTAVNSSIFKIGNLNAPCLSLKKVRNGLIRNDMAARRVRCRAARDGTAIVARVTHTCEAIWIDTFKYLKNG